MLTETSTPATRPAESHAETRARDLPALLNLALAAVVVAAFAVVLLHVLEFDRTAPGRVLFRLERSQYLNVLTRLPRGLDLLLVVTAFLASAVGPGQAVLGLLRIPWHDEAERILLGIPAGLALYTFAIMGLAWAGQLWEAPLLALFAAAAAMTALYSVGSVRRLRRSGLAGPSSLGAARTAGTIALLLGIVYLAYTSLLPALGPEVEFDARWYHLGIPYHYVLHHGFFDIVRVTNISAGGFPQYQEILYSGLIPVVGTIGAKLLHWWDAILAVLLLVYICRVHLRSAVIGLIAALLFLGTPVVSWSMGTGGNDLPLAPLTLVALHCYLRWRTDRAPGWLAAAGLIGGYSVGVKLFGSITLILIGAAVLYDLLRSRPPAPLRAYGVSAAALVVPALLACVPWLVHSYQLTGDPVFPTLFHFFRTPYWTDYMNLYGQDAYLQYGARQTLLGFVRLPWDLTFHPVEYRSLMGPIWLALVPLVLLTLALARGRSASVVRLLTVFVLLSMVAWFGIGALEMRYADGPLAVAAVVVGYAIYNAGRGIAGRPLVVGALAAVLAVSTVINSQLFVELQKDGWADGVMAARNVIFWNYVYGHPTIEETYSLPVEQWMNTHLSRRSDKVFDGTLQVSNYLYTDIELYSGSFYDSPQANGRWGLGSPDALAHLRAERITYVLLTPEQVRNLRGTAIYPHLRLVYANTYWNQQVLKVI